jgi:hypothetical protein
MNRKRLLGLLLLIASLCCLLASGFVAPGDSLAGWLVAGSVELALVGVVVLCLAAGDYLATKWAK